MINLVKRIVLIVLLEPIARLLLELMVYLGMELDRMMELTPVYHNIVLH